MERTHFQPIKILPILIMMVFLVATKLVMGSKDTLSIIGVSNCNSWFWFMQFLYILVALLICFVGFFISQWEYESKKLIGYVFENGDMHWENKKTIIVSLIAFLGGFFAAIAGIGGGVIFSPLLLSLDIHPQVAVATGLYLALWMTMGTSLIYFIAGRMNIYYGLSFSLFIIIATVSGLSLVSYIVRKTGRASFIVFLLCSLLLLALVATVSLDVTDFIKIVGRGEDLWEISSICSS